MSLEKINNRSPEAHLGLRAASVALFVLQTTALGQASELWGKNERVGGCGPTAGSISDVGSQLGPITTVTSKVGHYLRYMSNAGQR
jgi:hypothetical protein